MKSTSIALLILAFAAPALAQPRPAQEMTPLRGAARNAALINLTVRRDLTDTATQPTQSRPRSWVERHPVLMGTLVGASVGVALGAATCPSPIAEGRSDCDSYTDSSDARGAGALYFGGWGAGIGALVGLAAKALMH